jgi:putative 4-mercaptohistidine N1-methyltranferase
MGSAQVDMNRYETAALCNQYLLFHYGSDRDLMPFSFGPQNALHFPVRCVTECLAVEELPAAATALDLGCAVGRSSFELARSCKRVVAVDSSHTFIAAAKRLQQAGQLEYTILGEGAQQVTCLANLPEGVSPERVDFRRRDVMEFARTSEPFDVALAANLLCRLSDPRAFLTLLPKMVAPKGQLILTSPYSWLEEFTPKANWLTGTGKRALEYIQEALQDTFSLQRAFDLPFLIREHLRKYEWGVAEVSIWRRK